MFHVPNSPVVSELRSTGGQHERKLFSWQQQQQAAAVAARGEKVPQSVRHGEPGHVVHAVQVEEGLHTLRGAVLADAPRR